MCRLPSIIDRSGDEWDILINKYGVIYCICYSIRTYVCVFFIKLHIIAQSGPVLLVILCHSSADEWLLVEAAGVIHAAPNQTGGTSLGYWNWNIGNNRLRCFSDWSVYRCIERYCMTHRQRDDDNNLSVGNRNHLKLGIEPES